jgi:hypothetical protein
MKDKDAESNSRCDVHQAHESSCPWSNTPAGIGGRAGSPPVHHDPEQGRGGEGTGSGSDRPATSRVRSSIAEYSRPGSVRDVTR